MSEEPTIEEMADALMANMGIPPEARAALIGMAKNMLDQMPQDQKDEFRKQVEDQMNASKRESNVFD